MLSVFTPDLCAPRWPCAVRKSAAWTELSARPLSWRSKTSYLLYVYNMHRTSWIWPCMRRHFNWEKTLHLAKCSATNSSETKTALRSYLKTCQLVIFLKWKARSKSSCPVDTKPLVPLGLEISDPACNAKLTWLRPHVTGVPIKEVRLPCRFLLFALSLCSKSPSLMTLKEPWCQNCCSKWIKCFDALTSFLRFVAWSHEGHWCHHVGDCIPRQWQSGFALQHSHSAATKNQ